MKKKFGACLRKTMLLGMAALGLSLPLKAETLHVQFPEQLLTVRLDRLSELAGVAVTYDAGGMGEVRVPSLDARELTLDETLARTLELTAFEYRKVADGSYAVLPRAPQTPVGEGVLAGKIMDKDGFPIPGATLQIVGTILGVATDVKGEFSMALPAGRTYEVEVRCVSFQPMRISDIRIVEGETTPREALYLSEGAADLMYLAVRLAIVELTLPSEEPCPIVLDDALVNLDSARRAAAMEVLGEIAETRQVILFTCN